MNFVLMSVGVVLIVCYFAGTRKVERIIKEVEAAEQLEMKLKRILER